jgi:uncharacterized protein with PIN domain
MYTATVVFHGELNDFLARDQRFTPLLIDFNGHETVKHIIESLGVPHTEVDIVFVNGQSVHFEKKLKPGDNVDVYPSAESVTGNNLVHLKPDDLAVPIFVLDGHLGKLANYLRLLGFDTLYQNDFDDAELAEISFNEKRILLTRDRGLLKRGQVAYGYYVRAKHPKDQLVEIVGKFALEEKAKPFSRCANCNGLLQAVDKRDVYDRLEPKTKLFYDEFSSCDQCDQVYWKGSHFEQMGRFIEEVLSK